MKNFYWIILGTLVLSACAPNINQPSTQDVPILPTLELAPTLTAVSPSETLTSVPPQPDNFFTQMGIALPSPTCSEPTPQQQEGPYYTPNTPQRNSLLEDGVEGTRLILVGYVLDQNCQPLPNAWLDFWQAGADGEYDNVGYRLRGHQFTDEQGRYYLETVLPGLYQSRPIEHIHVKVKPEGGEEVISQLYFPQQPVDGLTVVLEERSDFLIGYFNFVVQATGD